MPNVYTKTFMFQHCPIYNSYHKPFLSFIKIHLHILSPDELPITRIKLLARFITMQENVISWTFLSFRENVHHMYAKYIYKIFLK